jgi:hypothetical protein
MIIPAPYLSERSDACISMPFVSCTKRAMQCYMKRTIMPGSLLRPHPCVQAAAQQEHQASASSQAEEALEAKRRWLQQMQARIDEAAQQQQEAERAKVLAAAQAARAAATSPTSSTQDVSRTPAEAAAAAATSRRLPNLQVHTRTTGKAPAGNDNIPYASPYDIDSPSDTQAAQRAVYAALAARSFAANNTSHPSSPSASTAAAMAATRSPLRRASLDKPPTQLLQARERAQRQLEAAAAASRQQAASMTEEQRRAAIEKHEAFVAARRAAEEAAQRQQRFMQQLSEEVSSSSSMAGYGAPGAFVPQADPMLSAAALEESRLLRALQDEEFLEAMQADQERVMQEQVAEQQEAAGREQQAALLALREALREALPDEPGAGEAAVVVVRVRLPGGGAPSRRFLAGDSVTSVKRWVGTLEEMPLVGDASWDLAVTFPRRVLQGEEEVGVVADGCAHVALAVCQH